MGHGIDALHRLTITYYLHGVNCLNVLFFRSKPTTPSVNVQEDCDTLISNWMTYGWPKVQVLQSGEVQLVALTAQTLYPLNAGFSLSSYTTQFGSATGEALPTVNAAVLSLYTQTPGKRTHGRMYIPGITEADTSQSVLISTALTKLKALGDGLIAQWGLLGTSSRFWGCVYSRKNGNTVAPGPPPYIVYSPLAAVPWSRHLSQNRLGTQRHRKQGRGI